MGVRFRLSNRMLNRIARPCFVGTRGLWGKNKSFSADIGKNKEDLIYKIQIHSCKTDAVDDYVALAEQNIRQISENEDIPQKLIGSFRVWYGKQDEVIHIWQYEGGYAALDEAASKTADLDSYNKYRAERAQMLKQRTNQLLVQFNYMPDPTPRDGKKYLRTQIIQTPIRNTRRMEFQLDTKWNEMSR